jgi:hypothetical protein
MLLASLGDFLWSLLVIFFMIVYFMMLFGVIIDIFRRRDIHGGKKTLWFLFLLFLPLVGLFTYVIVNSHGMAERRMAEMQQSQQQFDDYVQRTAGGGGTADEIAKAKSLLDTGTITQAEFEQIKAKALA